MCATLQFAGAGIGVSTSWAVVRDDGTPGKGVLGLAFVRIGTMETRVLVAMEEGLGGRIVRSVRPHPPQRYAPVDRFCQIRERPLHPL